ncbi:hypothetical protein V6N11_035438 [Hibiscus sabdariffa]|uniref:Uncharacterized protein n=1 Tax=Hibiscus sabdariffa TaxID=183260 RepID=A0ABR2R121_9ROSI
MMTSRTLPRLSISIWNCPSIETEVFLCYVVYRRFCFGEWSFSSGDSYEWDRFLKVGEMRSEEASKLLVQTEMYVSKYTCKGRAPLLANLGTTAVGGLVVRAKAGTSTTGMKRPATARGARRHEGIARNEWRRYNLLEVSGARWGTRRDYGCSRIGPISTRVSSDDAGKEERCKITGGCGDNDRCSGGKESELPLKYTHTCLD